MDAVLVGQTIEGVHITPLKQIIDERGCVMHMLRRDSPEFERFGEIYFSVVNPGVVKGWKSHLRMVQNYAVPRGEIKLVLFDDRPGPTRGHVLEILLGEMRYSLVRIPPQVWYSFKCLSKYPALIANCATMAHDPAEVRSLALDNAAIPYQWPH